MVFDSLPVYFDYRGRTWLIEFWKGQYGINTGAEIGVYHADGIIPESDYKTTWFTCAEDHEMLDCSFQLCKRGSECICNSDRHWWLTAFLVGCFSKPSALTMESCISFPNREMLCAFVDGLKRTGYPDDCLSVRGLTVCFVFHRDSTRYNLMTRFWRSFSQWKNKLFCKLYLWVTRPFSVQRTESYICITISRLHSENFSGCADFINAATDVTAGGTGNECVSPSQPRLSGCADAPLSDRSRYVLMSDCHRGIGSSSDNFLKNQHLYFAALQHYYRHGSTYIELGDGDELWENRSMKNIIDVHSNVFWLFKQFHEENRLYLIYGNHDIVKRKKGYTAKSCGAYFCTQSQQVQPSSPPSLFMRALFSLQARSPVMRPAYRFI